MVEFGRGICNEYALSSQREWLVTNGIGGFASGTIAGSLTRHYHGLLIAALKPPLDRTLTLVKLDETVVYDERIYRLAANHMEDGAIEPRGFKYLDRFMLEGSMPVWTFAFADALIEKRIWMEYGENTTYIRYTLRRSQRPVTLSLKALVNYRDYHASTHVTERDWQMQIEPLSNGISVLAQDDSTRFYVLASGGEMQITPRHAWQTGFFKAIEHERGTDELDDHLHAADFEIVLHPHESITLIATINPDHDRDTEAAYERRIQYENQIVKQIRGGAKSSTLRRLALAADQFIVRRDEGHTVLAGYPWFTDWGRDTMIALPGLTLTTGRTEMAASILRMFAKYVDQGMLPNRFPDVGETPEYNTVDATLWYFEAIRAYYEATGDEALVDELFPVLQSIIEWHLKGTRYGIHVDPSDQLLAAGEEGVQLTWMDVKINSWVVTPRAGKPVEINALWYNALRIMADFAWRLGKPAGDYDVIAERVRASFKRFWNGVYCYDVLDGVNGHDATLRPNQLFAVSLHYSPLSLEQQRAVVDICGRYLLTPHGLRSLSRDDEAYIGVHIGDPATRDAAYHQGTVWSWLIGAFVGAHLRVYDDKPMARTFLEPLIRHLNDAGVGSISEIFDGDAPHTPRGCFAQAWSVAEVLRMWQIVGR